MGSSFLLCLAVAVLLCASAQAKGPASVPPPKYQFLSFQLLEIETAATASNFGPLGTTSFGGVSTFRNIIQDYNTGKTIGHDEGSCVFTVAVNETTGEFEQECGFTIVIDHLDGVPNSRGGSFTVTGQALITPTPFAVVGGTGLFSGATGVCTTNEFESTEDFVSFGYNCEIFVLTPPLTPAALSPKAPGPIAPGPAP